MDRKPNEFTGAYEKVKNLKEYERVRNRDVCHTALFSQACIGLNIFYFLILHHFYKRQRNIYCEKCDL